MGQLEIVQRSMLELQLRNLVDVFCLEASLGSDQAARVGKGDYSGAQL